MADLRGVDVTRKGGVIRLRIGRDVAWLGSFEANVLAGYLEQCSHEAERADPGAIDRELAGTGCMLCPRCGYQVIAVAAGKCPACKAIAVQRRNGGRKAKAPAKTKGGKA